MIGARDYLRYAVAHVATILATAAIYWAGLWFFEISFVLSEVPLIASVIGAMHVGGRVAELHRRVPTSKEAWRFAMIATFLSLALLALMHVALLAVYPAFMTALVNGIGREFLGWTQLALFVAVVLLFNRYGFALPSQVTLWTKAMRESAKRGDDQ
jgi:hypothetical protein